MTTHSGVPADTFVCDPRDAERRTVREWWYLIQQHQPDSSQLRACEEYLLRAIQTGLNYDWEFNDAVELLLMLFPFFGLVLGGLARWWPLLFDALCKAQDVKDSELQMRVFTQIGESHLMFGKHTAARSAFNTALERARDRQVAEMMLNAYIGLIKIEAIQLSDHFGSELVERTLALEAQVTDGALKAALYQSLANAYIFRRDSLPALNYGQMAYLRWRQLGSHLEMGRTAIILSQAYRYVQRFHLSARLLDVAQGHLAQTDYARQEALSALEEGSLRVLERRDFEPARQWLEIALREFSAMGLNYYATAARHTLALAQIELGEIEEARANLTMAVATWHELGSLHEEANAVVGLAYLEAVAKRPAAAFRQVRLARGLCARLPASAFRSLLEEQIQEVLDMVGSRRPGEEPQADTA